MKLRCSSCCHEIEPAGGEPPPPWCRSCGGDLEPLSFETPKQPESPGAPQATVDVVRTDAVNLQPASVDAARLQCGGCGWTITVQRGEAFPPWCSRCGADVKAEAKPGSGDGLALKRTASDSSSVSAREFRNGELLPDILQPHLEPNSVATDLPGGDPAKIGHDERFASHNFLVGAVLALWGFLAANGMAGSPDQDVLESHPILMSIIDGLQVVAMLTGVALVVSGAGLRSGQRWGLRLAMWCAVASVLSGVAFLGAWQFLRHEAAGGEMVEAVAVMTFVRHNLDLLIGLVDGGALFVFLAKHRAAPDGQIRRRGGRASAAFGQ